MEPITASIASLTIESLNLPPVSSSPFPIKRTSGRLISLAHIANVGSQTMLALFLERLPSGILHSSLKR